MTITRVRSPGLWTDGSTVSAAEFEALDGNIVKAPDFVGGGTYAPASQVIIGGSGLKVTTAFEVTGTSVIGEVVFTGITTFNLGFESVGPAQFSADVTMADDLTVDDDLNVGGDLDVTDNAHVGGNLTADGALFVGLSASIDGDVTVGDDLTVVDDATIGGALTVSGTFNAAANWSLTGSGFLQEQMALTGNGRIRYRYTAAPDAVGADKTLGISSGVSVDAVGDVFKVPATGGTYIVSDTAASAGSMVMLFKNANGGSSTIKRGDGSTIGTLSAGTGGHLMLLVHSGSQWELVTNT